MCSQDGKGLHREKKYIELGTLKNGVYFTTRALKDLATEYKEITDLYARTQQELVSHIVEIACEQPRYLHIMLI